ncbi:S8 family peptidase [Gloeocapsa sp. PCC 73106]|uniref:S8 family peptidase n=1 Tax=Gloeocapsa sp. PCC 73106 TaxID=102232 RepID=UPI0002ACD3DA|nr:S8 family peptidase [Gloeocapsa sp. PCC 73106]ELR97596.1 subtilisin-like serine protease [Gloeocapsa sp. PCC 73106]
MKRLLLLILFLVGLGFAVVNYPGLANQGEFDSIVLDFREDLPKVDIRASIEAIAHDYNREVSLNSVYSTDDHIYVVEGDKTLLNNLRRSPVKKLTEYIEPNYIYRALEVPNDPEYSKQWNLRSINVEQAWDEAKGSGITVAVIDTGVSKAPDFQQTEFVEGYDFVNDRSGAGDDVGHGTHVAGTIAQSTNNNYGVAGIAYQAKIMPIKVLGATGGGTIADIAEGIRFAADHDADVINLSLGGGGASNLMEEAIDYAYSKGVVIVAAAGNSNQNASAYPARYPKVIGVAALDSGGDKAEYSNFGAGVDISAPGGGKESKIVQNTIDPKTGEFVFAGYQGTSMATPHVAGVAALVKELGVQEPAVVLSVLKQSARKIEQDPLNHYGAGQLDAANAVKLALRGQLSFRDFFRWIRDNGYLNPRFWIDGGAVALLPKIAMVLGSYLLAWLLRNYFPFGWSWSLSNGLILGSSGLFLFRGFYIFDLPQWPFRLLGSSLSELGNVVQGTTLLNPLFASVLIPFLLIGLLSSNQVGKWFAVGCSLGMASALGVMAIASPDLWLIGTGAIARGFLVVNALLCFGLGYLASQGEAQVL